MRESELAAGHDSLAPVLDATRAHRLAQFHRQVNMPVDLSNRNHDAHGEMRRVLDRDAFEVRQQRREALRVRHQIEHFLRAAVGDEMFPNDS